MAPMSYNAVLLSNFPFIDLPSDLYANITSKFMAALPTDVSSSWMLSNNTDGPQYWYSTSQCDLSSYLSSFTVDIPDAFGLPYATLSMPWNAYVVDFRS